jgi:hypothetical protein
MLPLLERLLPITLALGCCFCGYLRVEKTSVKYTDFGKSNHQNGDDRTISLELSARENRTDLKNYNNYMKFLQKRELIEKDLLDIVNLFRRRYRLGLSQAT